MKEYHCTRCGKKIQHRIHAPIRISTTQDDMFGSFELQVKDVKGKTMELCPECRNDLTNIMNNWIQGFL